VFLTVAVRIIERHNGVVLTVAADKVTAAWNAFAPMPNHESRAAACAFDLRTALNNSEQELWLPDLHWCVCVARGDVVVGNSGTESDRAPVVQGPCVDLAMELPPLLIAIGVQVAVSDTVRTKLTPSRDRNTPWHTVPVDRITLADGETEVIMYELRTGAAPLYMSEFESGFDALMDGRCSEAKAIFQSIAEGNVAETGSNSNSTAKPGAAPRDRRDRDRDRDREPDTDPQIVRLLKLSGLFGSLGVAYVRALPVWQRFEFDATVEDEVAPQRERRHVAEKRKSVMPDDVLRTELMNLHNMRVAKQSSPKNSLTVPGQKSPPGLGHRMSTLGVPAAPATRRRSSVHDGARRPSVAFVTEPTSIDHGNKEDGGGTTGAGGLLSAENGRGRRMSKRPFTDAASFSLNAALGGDSSPTNAPPPIAITGSGSGFDSPGGTPNHKIGTSTSPLRPALQSGVIEFRDRKGMLFRVSSHVLGRGAAGEVLLGISETGCLVAVKNVPIPKPVAGVEQLNEIQKRRLRRKGMNVSTDVMVDVEKLLTEVSVLARLRDEHIVGYLSSAILGEGNHLAVVMEYISGGSLQGLLNEFDSVPVRTVKRYLRDILKGLQFLHKEGIIHRDLKPHNVLLLIDGSCKLTDFGTSSSMGKIAGTTDVVGTPQYMAPEACRGESLGTSSDIWSFGVLMAQLITGKMPWIDDGMYVPIRFMYQVGHIQTMTPVIDGDCPEAARDLIMECCQRDASKRPSAEELLHRPFFAASPTPMRSGRGSRAGSHRSRRSQSAELTPSTVQLPQRSSHAHAAQPNRTQSRATTDSSEPASVPTPLRNPEASPSSAGVPASPGLSQQPAQSSATLNRMDSIATRRIPSPFGETSWESPEDLAVAAATAVGGQGHTDYSGMADVNPHIVIDGDDTTRSSSAAPTPEAHVIGESSEDGDGGFRIDPLHPLAEVPERGESADGGPDDEAKSNNVVIGGDDDEEDEEDQNHDGGVEAESSPAPATAASVMSPERNGADPSAKHAAEARDDRPLGDTPDMQPTPDYQHSAPDDAGVPGFVVSMHE
jgi:serine/threonine protein kinase